LRHRSVASHFRIALRHPQLVVDARRRQQLRLRRLQLQLRGAHLRSQRGNLALQLHGLALQLLRHGFTAP
jgi:hypothetical protein